MRNDNDLYRLWSHVNKSVLIDVNIMYDTKLNELKAIGICHAVLPNLILERRQTYLYIFMHSEEYTERILLHAWSARHDQLSRSIVGH